MAARISYCRQYDAADDVAVVIGTADVLAHVPQSPPLSFAADPRSAPEADVARSDFEKV